MKYLQKLGKALMLPVSCLPLCGLLMGIGYVLCPSAMQGGAIAGLPASIGFFLIKAGGALIDNIALLFAIGVGVGMSEKNDGTGGLAALASWLMMTTLLNKDTVATIIPALNADANGLLAFSKIANPFIGILAGIIGSTCYNRFKDTRLTDWLSFFSGKRCVAIVAGLLSIAVSVVLLFVWPLIFTGLITLGNAIAGLGAFGAGIYAVLNRALIPTGLHHALNNVFWFDTIGLGDLTHFWAGHTSADVTWSLGMYMSGFFPCMMFGVPGAALAIVHSAKPERRKAVFGMMISCAICSFVCGVTEPFTFSFVFLSPLLFGIYALLYGLITILTVFSGFRAGFSFSAGATDLLFSAPLPAAAKTWLILPLGILSFALFYGVFRLTIAKLDIKTPGREEEPESEPATAEDSLANAGATEEAAPQSPAANTNAANVGSDTADSVSAQSDANNKTQSVAQNVASNTSLSAAQNAANNKPLSATQSTLNNTPLSAAQSAENNKPLSVARNTAKKKSGGMSDFETTAANVLKGLGGPDNLLSIDNCITRLRLEVRNPALVDEEFLRASGIPGVIKTGKHSVQVVIGMKVQFVADALHRQTGL